MERVEFLRLLDALLELEPGALTGPEELQDHGWDSLAALGFMALVEEQFGVIVSPDSLIKSETVDDLIAIASPSLAQ